MKIPSAQAEVVAFLSQLVGAPPIETAGALLFQGSDGVFKLRKAIERPLADWKTRRARRAGARYDLAIAGARAPGLYRGALAVRRSPAGGLTLAEDSGGDDPAAIDWVLHLNHIPAEDCAAAMIGGGAEDGAQDALDGRQMDLIADAIVDLHASLAAQPMPGMEPAAAGASPETLRLLTLNTVRLALEAGLAQPEVMQWAGLTLERLEAAAPVLDRRAAAGLARPGHGNLHLGNICRWRYEWVLLDARAPNPTIGVPDIAWDLAPLLVELEARLGRDASNRLLSRYIARTGDIGMLPLLPLLMSLRAMLFGADLAARDGTMAVAYSRLAGLYHGAARSVVVAIGGLPGVGKTTLARALAPGLGVGPGAVVLRADDIRKRLAGRPPEAPPDSRTEDAALSQDAYATLAAHVQAAALAGHAAVADATFLDPVHRAAIRAAAVAAGVPFIGIWLDAPMPDLGARLAARPFDASDSTLETLRAANLANPGALDWRLVDAVHQDAALAAIRAAIAGATAV